jgi:outer membrane protein assembly factor BamB
MPRVFTIAALLLTLTGATAAADDIWPGFRGRNAGVAADDPRLPDTWSTTENVAWKAEIPGLGWSSPVVWNDLVFVTSVVSSGLEEPPKPGLYLGGPVLEKASASHRFVLHAFDLKTGARRWTRDIHESPPGQPKHLKNSYASETPVTDGERVYAYFGDVGLFAVDMTGALVWSKPMGPFKTRNGWGTGASPVLHGDRIYVVNDNDEQSFLAAFDKRTGADVWRVNRDEGTNWATPYVWENSRRTEIVTPGTDRVRSYDLEGRLLWEFTGMSSITIPTPFSRGDLLYISSGYLGDPLRPTYAVRPGASGNITLASGETGNAYIAWSAATIAPYNTTPIVYGDILYTLLDRGFLTAHDAKTGREIYGRQRIAPDAGAFTASPWAYNGKLFALSEDGDTYVIQAGPEFKVLAKNALGDMALATPAVVGAGLVVRTKSSLYRIARTEGTR